MDMRSRVNSALKQAMKEKQAERLSTLRLINAAIKDRDIATRGIDNEEAKGCGDAEVLEILGKMTKQRKESARAYEEGGRLDLAEREMREVDVIEEFLPKQLDADEVANAIHTAITATGAGSIRDMGKVMGELKTRYTGQMDFGKVGPMVKDHLCAASNGADGC
ncbi:GatB/YqeY domain-containing protein [Ruegeria arenilitoris]|uniref:GatB/YqeY domain-containing protein n=1 Tax=Ruegeria arenilitoris TaxID=1173585 RepID=UPI00147EF3C0|nr:GatB/YqeY domain-containing protein [Ruegeria arenilitoris]